jgi:hypothetical protein
MSDGAWRASGATCGKVEQSTFLSGRGVMVLQGRNFCGSCGFLGCLQRSSRSSVLDSQEDTTRDTNTRSHKNAHKKSRRKSFAYNGLKCRGDWI